jgi:hypothetical protein
LFAEQRKGGSDIGPEKVVERLAGNQKAPARTKRDQAGTKSLSTIEYPFKEERAAQRLERTWQSQNFQKTTQKTAQKIIALI